MRLLIVESPTKSKTIAKYLGKDFSVASSYGHIRDLPKGDLGVDTEHNFKPKYVIPTKARKLANTLKKEAAKAKETILATDSDREGESIAWHLAHILGLKEPKRIVFHEITKQAIENALKKPRKINLDLVNAQQARRILDRLVGYKLSPFLWKKVVRGLSAGRVQSVAVRLVAEREREIEKFKPDEYWSVEALLQQKGRSSPDKEILRPRPARPQNDNQLAGNQFKALLAKKNGKTLDKLAIKNKKGAEEIVKELEGAEYQVEKIEKKEAKRNPLPPFQTSALQQTAANRLGFSPKKTMLLAQRLYETGLISYHRTDSLNLSSQSQAGAKQFIENNFGKDYWPGYARNYKTKAKTAQEAHEAIRPTQTQKTPEALKGKLETGQAKLYDLIWHRFLASQMSPARFNSTKVEVKARNPKSKVQNSYIFKAAGQTIQFAGFLKLYPLKFTEEQLPELTEQEQLALQKLIPEQHFTQPPPRYSEASLIKTLEKEGIGRPSTYAPILDTIQQRNYVQKNEQKKFQPTEIGLLVNDLLVEHFHKFVDLKFTAKMEENLDEVAEGKQGWVGTLSEFYGPFEKNLKEKMETVKKQNPAKPTDKICPDCQKPLVIRMGRFGKFYACSGFPNCKYTAPLEKKELNISCPKCGQGKITEKRTRKGKLFYGCSNWPHCDFALWDKPTGEKCPKCDGLLLAKGKKITCSNKQCSYGKNA